MVNTDRVMVQLDPDETGDGSSIYDCQWIHYVHCTPFLLLLSLCSWIYHGKHATSWASPLSIRCNPTLELLDVHPTNEPGGWIVLENGARVRLASPELSGSSL